MKPASTLLAVTLVLGSVPCEAAEGLSQASELSALGAASIAAGSLAGVTGSAELVVESVEWLAKGCRVVLRGASEVGRVVLLIPPAALAGVSVAAGATVLVALEGTGWILSQAGQVIAYVPRQVRRELLFSQPER